MTSPIPIDRARRERSEHPALGLVVALVRLRAIRRLAWQHALVEAGEPGSADDLAAERSFYEESSELIETNRRIDRLEQALRGEPGGALRSIAEAFALTSSEFDLLSTCLALDVEPELGGLFARLQGSSGRGYVTESLAARIFGWGRRTMWSAGGRLATWGLVHTSELGPGQPPLLTVDRQVRARIEGELGLDAELVGVAAVAREQTPLDSWPLAPTLARVRRALEAERAIRLVLIGPAGSGRRSFAAGVAARLGSAALVIDTDEISDERWHELHVRAMRLCVMGGMSPVWAGERVDRRWPRSIEPVRLQFIACEDPSRIQRQLGAVDEQVILPDPGLDERRQLWSRMVPDSAAWSSEARERLATRHRLSVGDLAEIGRRMPESAEQAAMMAREQTRGRLGELGRLLDCPFGWDDLVLAERVRDGLEHFSFEAGERARFWEGEAARRLFPRGMGLVGLLIGPPGTGKTMAAQVIAAELELDLFRINLATVVSKYIGETAKNLDRIFSRASRMNAVLLFDEADALFSKRTEVRDSHDRYANTDTNYLLQLLEDYQGIALLASNKKNNIDPAFIRRIRYVLEFQRPDARQRLKLWRKVIGELVGADSLRPLEPAIATLAEAVELSGAQIKNSVLASLFVARRAGRPLAIEHLIAGIDRELGKEGRAINDRERERLRRR